MFGLALLSKLLLGVSLLSSGALSIPTPEVLDLSAWSTPIPRNESSGLVPRADNIVYSIWNPIPNKVEVNRAQFFGINRGPSGAWGPTFLFGCAAIVIYDPNFTVIGHLAQEGAGGCTLQNPERVLDFVEDVLTPAWSTSVRTADTRAFIFYAPASSGTNRPGLDVIQDNLQNEYGLPAASITEYLYLPPSGVSGPQPNSNKGLCVVQWISNNAGGGTLRVYFDSDTPRSDVQY